MDRSDFESPARSAPPSPSAARARQAATELGGTAVGRGTAWAMIVLFLLTVAGVPIADLATAARDDDVPAVEGAAGDRAPGGGLLERNRALRRAMTRWEERLEERSLTRRWVMPRVQRLWTGLLGVGNGRVIVGAEGELFLRDDVSTVLGRDFLAPRQLRARVDAAAREGERLAADPVPAILAFRDDLRRRGIDLLLVPTPVKPVAWENVGQADFYRRLESAGISYYDPAAAIRAEAANDTAAPYLQADTHWTPEVASLAAAELAERVERIVGPAPGEPARYRVRPVAVEGRGDLARMLGAGEALAPSQRVEVAMVTDRAGRLWRPDRRAEILLLGDSFSEIYSDPDLGWGGGAGLGEQLSAALGRPLDRVTVRGGGAHASRAALDRDLAAGRDRLAGKKLVIWQFATRELAHGDWRMLPLPPTP